MPSSALRAPLSRAGFTLVEVVLVCAVLGLLLVSSVPRFQQAAQRLRVEQTAFELAQLLRSAHERAVSEGRDIVWVWDDRVRRARIESGSAGGSNDTDEPSQPLDTHVVVEGAPIQEGISVSLTRKDEAVACNCVRFFPEGTSESATLTVRWRERLSYTVTVDEATSQVLLFAGAVAR
jgi:type II secretion system protein H